MFCEKRKTVLFTSPIILLLPNVPTSSNHLKTKVDYLDVGKLKLVPVDLKILSDAPDNEIVKTQNSTY